MSKRGKRYRDAAKGYDPETQYPLTEAVDLVKKMATSKFDETVEVSLKLNMKKNHSVRDTTVLPHQFREGKKILVFAKGDKATEAQEAGAAYVGDSDLVEKIKDGWLDFDVAVATPDMMKEVGKLGPILGRRGLMPNPKAQTVTFDIKGALEELNKGRLEFRADKTGVVHMAVGKASMASEQIEENAKVLIEEVTRRRPADLKGEFVKSVAVSSTMGPGVKVAKDAKIAKE
jgi:large subunit ribosomal protein L1